MLLTIVVTGQDGMEVISMIDLLLVTRDMLKYVYDVKTVRELARGILDSSVVLYKNKRVTTWLKRWRI